MLLGSFALIASPIAFTGHEYLDVEQEAGFVLIPAGLLIILFGASDPDPHRLTVGGTFGNPEEDALRRRNLAPRPVPSRRSLANPKEPVHCGYCHTWIPAEAANCSRCGRARACRVCQRPVGLISNRVTCPACGREEVFCSCPRWVRPAGTGGISRPTVFGR